MIRNIPFTFIMLTTYQIYNESVLVLQRNAMILQRLKQQ